MRDRVGRCTVAVATAALVGCGSMQITEHKEKISFRSNPPGAVVRMMDKSGTRGVGVTPVDAEVAVEHGVFKANHLSTWLTTAGLWLATAPFLYFAINPGQRESFDGTLQDNNTIRAVMIPMTSTFGIMAVMALGYAIYNHTIDGTNRFVRYKEGPPVIAATLPGYIETTLNLGAKVIPPKAPIELNLVASGVVPPPSPAAEPAFKPAMAVFDIDAPRFKKSQVKSLSDYLAARIAEDGRFAVVPRSSLRKRLAEEKATSQKECFDEACQIELGKAVAAQKSLATKILRTEEECTITGTIFDLRREVAERARTAHAACDVKSLMGAIESLSQQLASAKR